MISPLGENPSLEEDGTVNLLSADISAYSFDRLVVCDRPEIAQFLLANDFHREHNCAVLSVTGYPTRIFSPLLEMLRQNPNLKVYALHDASPRGVSLSHTLRTSPNWFPDPQIEMIDIGILPRQVFKNPKAIVQNLIRSNTPIEPIPAEVRQSLSHDEIVWLERGNYVDLESFPPYKLLQIVAQSLATNRELQPERESEREPVAFEIGGGFFAASEDFG
ncbi:MAG: hypothetical protein WBD58_08390 [Geitlerinemataceae cyanobacterium]